MTVDRIADASDLATAHEELLRESALQLRKASAPEPCGACLNCGEPLEPGLRWCDTDCRDDWEAVLRRQGERG